MTDRSNRILLAKSRDTALKELGQAFADWMQQEGLYKSCLNCCDWQELNETCGKYKMRPPAKVIICGCEHHTDIPF
jgi:hypothetical protein